ncbi:MULTISPECIES: HAD family hydrolase [Pseudomonas]|uniref:HAD family hydrolase n=1 Tax=Pseudomonas TaxID=286 RepID=UPI001F080DB1|nr:HAD family hydrolase [Pseudomonas parafulva]
MARHSRFDQWRSGSRKACQGVARLFRRPRVRISFDIDDTLACLPEHSPTEHSKLPDCVHRWLGEPLRRGTRELMRDLRRQGYSIWIYTSSGRSPAYIRRWLLLYGIRVDGVVNSDRHQQVLAAKGVEKGPSKLPSAFDIDLHVDDSEGVGIEGDDHGFRVVVVCPKDGDWTHKVMAAAAAVQAQLAWQQPLRHRVPAQALLS